MVKLCTRCQAEFNAFGAHKHNKVCGTCANEIKKELADAGYLSPRPYTGRYRQQDARESTRETKFGVDR